MKFGRLRHRVRIDEKMATRNGFGEEVITWSQVGVFWASVEPLRGREFVEMRQAHADVTTRIRLRVQDMTITPAMLATYDGREFEIESVIEVNERGRELHLMCRERVVYG